MSNRLLTSLVGLPLLFAIIWTGSPLITALVIISAFIGFIEFRRLAILASAKVAYLLTAPWLLLFLLCASLSTSYYYQLIILIVGSIILFIWTVINQRNAIIKNYAYSLIAPICLGFLLSHALLINGTHVLMPGEKWLFLVIIVTFATDTGAFLTGKFIGKHKLAPTISPGKTWEGAAGGIIWAIASALIINYIVTSTSDLTYNTLGNSTGLIMLGLLGVNIGVIAQCGDLCESILKRKAGVKNSSSLLPGHGGILDRLDSIVFTIPVMYYWIKLVL